MPGMAHQARAEGSRRSGWKVACGPSGMHHGPERDELYASRAFEGVARDDATRHSQKRHLRIAHERRVLGDVLRLEPGIRLRVHSLFAKDVERGHEHPARTGAGIAYRDIALIFGLHAVGKHHLRDHPGDVVGREELRARVYRKAEGVVDVSHDIPVGIRLKRIDERREHPIELAGEPRISC